MIYMEENGRPSCLSGCRMDGCTEELPLALFRPAPSALRPLLPLRLDRHVLLLVKRGSMELQREGESISVHARQLADFAGESVPVWLTAVSDDFRGCLFAFSGDFLFGLFQNRPPIGADYVHYTYRHPVLTLDADTFTALSLSLTQVHHLLRRHLPAGGVGLSLLRSHVRVFFTELSLFFLHYDFGSTLRRAPSNRHVSIFGRFLALLREHARTRHDVGFYAAELCITPQYLSRITRAVAGRSAGQLVWQAVTDEAKRLLREDDVPLADIARTMHFADQAVFAKFFRRQVGCTPSDYRNGCHEGPLRPTRPVRT